MCELKHRNRTEQRVDVLGVLAKMLGNGKRYVHTLYVFHEECVCRHEQEEDQHK